MTAVHEASPTRPDMTPRVTPPRARETDTLTTDQELADLRTLISTDLPSPDDLGPPLSPAEVARTRRQLLAGWGRQWHPDDDEDDG
jgi:hypothetical protein